MAPTLVLRTALSIFLAAPIGKAAAQDDVERGLALVTRLCAECHAVGRTGASPNGRAPTFRSLDDHTDLDEFIGRLRQGQQANHPDRPAFRFSRDDAEAAVAYLRSIQGP
ncbi:MAG: cytochrome c [Xanthobacteraceae bacterium]|nr:cytochrome c [Xanthobacteraceae bacterium]